MYASLLGTSLGAGLYLSWGVRVPGCDPCGTLHSAQHPARPGKLPLLQLQRWREGVGSLRPGLTEEQDKSLPLRGLKWKYYNRLSESTLQRALCSYSWISAQRTTIWIYISN